MNASCIKDCRKYPNNFKKDYKMKSEADIYHFLCSSHHPSVQRPLLTIALGKLFQAFFSYF